MERVEWNTMEWSKMKKNGVEWNGIEILFHCLDILCRSRTNFSFHPNQRGRKVVSDEMEWNRYHSTPFCSVQFQITQIMQFNYIPSHTHSIPPHSINTNKPKGLILY